MHAALETDREALTHHRYWSVWWSLLLCTPITAGITFAFWLWWLKTGKVRARRWADHYQVVIGDNRLTVVQGTEDVSSQTVPLDQITGLKLAKSAIAACSVLTLQLKTDGQSIHLLGLQDAAKAQEMILSARDGRLS